HPPGGTRLCARGTQGPIPPVRGTTAPTERRRAEGRGAGAGGHSAFDQDALLVRLTPHRHRPLRGGGCGTLNVYFADTNGRPGLSVTPGGVPLNRSRTNYVESELAGQPFGDRSCLVE